MVSLTALAVPILVAAVLVFLASFVIHMLLPIHRSDWRRVPAEDRLLDAIRNLNLAPGDYAAPHAGSPEAMKNPEFVATMQKGPVVSIVAAYITGRALGPGAKYLDVFRFAGAAAFAGYSLALFHNSIWYMRNWSATIKSAADGLVYAQLTAGTSGWLWPR